MQLGRLDKVQMDGCQLSVKMHCNSSEELRVKTPNLIGPLSL